MKKSRFTTYEVGRRTYTGKSLLTAADYVSVVVSGILAKAQKLCKLQVRLCLSEFQWTEEQILCNTNLLLGPFERLRNVRQVSLGGVFRGRPDDNSMLFVSPQVSYIRGLPSDHLETCSVPSIPTNNPVLAAGMPAFDAYASEWKRKISSESSTAVTEEPPIRRMFAEFRNFYTQLSSYVPDIMYRSGKHTFLHRARVAREQEDVIAFREIQKELVHYWTAYLINEEDRKSKINKTLGSLLDSDKYPSHVWEETSTKHPKFLAGNSAQSPILLDSDRVARDSMPARKVFPPQQSDRDLYLYHEAEIRRQHSLAHQGIGWRRTLTASNGVSLAVKCTAEVAESYQSDSRQQRGLQQFIAAMDIDSSPSTIAGDDLYDAAFDNHYAAPEGEPGPSTKRRRIDYARHQSEIQRSQHNPEPHFPPLYHSPYPGKGKGKADG